MKREKLYGIFRTDERCSLLGLVENSFSLSWRPDYVRVWTQKQMEWYLSKNGREIERNGIFAIRLAAKNKPIECDWSRRNSGKKFEWRNIPFWMKDNA